MQVFRLFCEETLNWWQAGAAAAACACRKDCSDFKLGASCGPDCDNSCELDNCQRRTVQVPGRTIWPRARKVYGALIAIP